jgi:hypothetical protein
MARETERLTIGWGIISPFTRHPVQVAMDARVVRNRMMLGCTPRSFLKCTSNWPAPFYRSEVGLTIPTASAAAKQPLRSRPEGAGGTWWAAARRAKAAGWMRPIDL